MKKKKEKSVEKKAEVLVKKDIIPRTAVRGLINGFISYSIILIFLFAVTVFVVAWAVNNNKESIDYNVLKYSLPLIGAFLIYFIVKATCRLSTFDLLKKCKIKEDEINKVCTRMNLFYLGVVAFSVITIIFYLIVIFSNRRIQITKDVMNYNKVSYAYAQEKERELTEEYEANRSDTLMQTTIIEMGLLLGIFSLIPNQKKLIQRYN